jgi:hypothetical protein
MTKKRSLLKKILKWFGIAVLFLLILILLLPVFFKGKIINIVKTQANASLNAYIDFDENIRIGLIGSFPHFTVGLKNLSVINKAPFEGDTLLQVGAFEARINLMSVIRGDHIKINKILINDALIHLHILPDGLANWDITLSDTSEIVPEESTEEEESLLNIALKQYSIVNAHIIYNDEEGGILVDIEKLNHKGSGDFTLSFFNLVTQTDIERLSFAYGGIKYLNKASAKLDATLEIDLDNSKYSMLDNLLQINDFFLQFNGFVAMPDTSIHINMSFAAAKTEFKNLISLIPAVFMTDFESLQSSGTMAFDGAVKGTYNSVSMPGFDIRIDVDKGMFKYPDLPAAINNVHLNLRVENKDGEPDHTVINLSRLHFELDKEGFDARMLVKTPVSDPHIEAYLKGKIDLNQIQKLIELEEGNSISGIILSDLEINGNLSSIENEKYEDFHAIGNIGVSDMLVQSEPGQKISIPAISMVFSPKYVSLEDFQVIMGKNDLSATGNLSNFIPYFFGKGTLLGVLNVHSNYFNLNPLMQAAGTQSGEMPAPENDTASYQLEAVELPANIDFTMNASFGKLIYDELHMTDISSKIILRDQILEIQDMKMHVFDGSMQVKGHYDTRIPEKPNIHFDLAIEKMKFREAYNSFGMIRKYAPLLKHAQGDFNAKMKIKSDLNTQMEPLYPTLNSEGILDISAISIEGSGFQTELAKALKNDDLKSFSLSKMYVSYIIENGAFRLKDPLKFNIDKTACSLEGSTSLDQSINYIMDMKIPAGEIKDQSNTLISSLSGGALSGSIGDHIDLSVLITGNVDQPKLKVVAGDMVKEAKDQLKEQAKEELEKKKEEIREQAKEEIDKAKAEAEEKARLEKERLEKEAERKKREAEEKARIEAEKKKKEMEEEAKKKLLKKF